MFSYFVNLDKKKLQNGITVRKNLQGRLSSGSYFSLLFLCSYFSLFFILKMPYYPYFLVQKMYEVTKNCNFFPHSLRSLRRYKNQINLIWVAKMQKFIKYFHFSCNSFFCSFILVFPFHSNAVLLFRENFVCLVYFFLSLKTFRSPLLSLLFMIQIPTFALLFQNFEPYFIHTYLMEGPWKPDKDKNIITISSWRDYWW